MILVPLRERGYMLALREAWVGGKKNDVTVVVGSVDGHAIDFADVLSWTPSGLFKVDLKDRIQDIGSLDRRDDIAKAIFDTTKTEFIRLHMKDLKYLMRSFQPSRTAMWVIFILATLAEIGLAWRSVTNSVTAADPKWTNRYGEFKG